MVYVADLRGLDMFCGNAKNRLGDVLLDIDIGNRRLVECTLFLV